MASLNKVTLIGNLGRDPELRQTQNGQQVAEFSIATSERWKDRGGEQQERTEWHRIVVWGPQAELASKYLSKGRSVYVEGRIQYRDWTDKDGNKRTTTEIVASNLLFLGGDSRRGPSDNPPPHGDHDAGPPARAASQSGNDFSDDEIPF